MYRDPGRNPDRRALHVDHSKSRSEFGIGNTVADRLLHASCNEQRGNGSRDDQRPALTGQPDGVDPDLGTLHYFDWP
jgi:hypothetical protein